MEKAIIKYTTDGKKVVVIGDLNQTEKIVQEVFVTKDGCEIPSGERFVVKSLLDKPAISWKEKTLNDLELKYKSQKEYWDKEISKLDSEKRLVSKQLKQVIQNIKGTLNNGTIIKVLENVDSFLCGEKLFILNEDWNKYIIKEFNPESDSFFAARYENRYGIKEFDSLRLISLFGKSNGDLCWGIHDYSVGSGRGSEFMFFRSKEECINKIQELVNSTDKYRDREIKASKDFGIKLDEEKTKVYFASLVKEKQDRLNKLKSDYEGLQKEIEEIEASK